MRKLYWIMAGILCCSLCFGGTLIYRVGKEEKRVSKLKILSIDNKKIIIEVNDGTKTLPLASIVKYYASDISGGEFDDNTADYTIRLGEGKISGDKKKGGTKTFTVSYDITRKQGQRADTMRQPYFYLFVLASNGEGGRDMTSYAFPSQAKASMKNYDEAKMLEKVISLKRPTFHESDQHRLGRKKPQVGLGGTRNATFSLSNLKNRNIIAWYLVAWSKNSIAATKEFRDDTSYSNISKTWWIR